MRLLEPCLIHPAGTATGGALLESVCHELLNVAWRVVCDELVSYFTRLHLLRHPASRRTVYKHIELLTFKTSRITDTRGLASVVFHAKIRMDTVDHRLIVSHGYRNVLAALAPRV